VDESKRKCESQLAKVNTALAKLHQDQARYALKLLCSIAVSNPTTPAAIVVACMGIKIGGNLVEGREEQRAVLEVLTQTEEGHGWPTRTLRSNLKEVWTARASSKDR
jgi:hypothetical protein